MIEAASGLVYLRTFEAFTEEASAKYGPVVGGNAIAT
jgi:hypothetical protein